MENIKRSYEAYFNGTISIYDVIYTTTPTVHGDDLDLPDCQEYKKIVGYFWKDLVNKQIQMEKPGPRDPKDYILAEDFMAMMTHYIVIKRKYSETLD